jgi:hypothetical protein
MGFHTWGIYLTEKHTTIFGAVNSDRANGNDVLVAALPALFPAVERSSVRVPAFANVL